MPLTKYSHPKNFSHILNQPGRIIAMDPLSAGEKASLPDVAFVGAEKFSEIYIILY